MKEVDRPYIEPIKHPPRCNLDDIEIKPLTGHDLRSIAHDTQTKSHLEHWKKYKNVVK